MTAELESADELDVSEVREVQGPKYTAGRGHGPTELARAVAAHASWQFARTDQLVDPDREVIAATIGRAAAAMQGLGWFGGDEDGTWIDWSSIPEDDVDKADAIRRWLADQAAIGQVVDTDASAGEPYDDHSDAPVVRLYEGNPPRQGRG